MHYLTAGQSDRCAITADFASSVMARSAIVGRIAGGRARRSVRGCDNSVLQFGSHLHRRIHVSGGFFLVCADDYGRESVDKLVGIRLLHGCPIGSNRLRDFLRGRCDEPARNGEE